MTAAVITVSDSVCAGSRVDKSGPAVRQRIADEHQRNKHPELARAEDIMLMHLARGGC